MSSSAFAISRVTANLLSGSQARSNSIIDGRLVGLLTHPHITKERKDCRKSIITGLLKDLDWIFMD